ncbi:unnamed protein product [Nippostrongylus brasiliensis]|uniref:Ribosomal_L7Ae domain-containing protein n=1 Tax=Nippostrongylus brasiliensis TaxID=27835 RepID=A0A0N4YUM7_NIPBR|nr:unnamed protein product [Nippostrongylus brasiliensis]
MVLAGNVSPIDVYSHLPGLCEDNEIPYCYVPSREQLGLAAGRLRPSIVVYIKPHADYQELYDEVRCSYRAHIFCCLAFCLFYGCLPSSTEFTWSLGLQALREISA